MVKILVVDDSRIFRNILYTTLSENGYDVVGMVPNGQECLDFLKENPTPDIITLDITMPVMDGIEALVKIRELYPTAKVIMVSASGQKQKVMDALKIGAVDFIHKPFKTEEINIIISRHCD